MIKQTQIFVLNFPNSLLNQLHLFSVNKYEVFYDLYNINKRNMIYRTKTLFRCRKHSQTTISSTGGLLYIHSASTSHLQMRKREPLTKASVEEFFTDQEYRSKIFDQNMRTKAPNQEYLSFEFNFDQENGEMAFDLPEHKQEWETTDRLENH